MPFVWQYQQLAEPILVPAAQQAVVVLDWHFDDASAALLRLRPPSVLRGGLFLVEVTVEVTPLVAKILATVPLEVVDVLSTQPTLLADVVATIPVEVVDTGGTPLEV